MAKTVTEAIGDVEIEKIKGPGDGTLVPIKSFWAEQGVVVHFLRRFGCRLCRGHAAELEQIVPTLEAHGWRVVAVGIEKFGLEEFQKGGYWSGELYIDNGKQALKALNVKQVSILVALKDIMFNKDVGAEAKKTKNVPGNLKGDGRQLGGTFVIAKGGDVLLDHRQKNFGDHASNDIILKAAAIDPSVVVEKTKDQLPPVSSCDKDCAGPDSINPIAIVEELNDPVSIETADCDTVCSGPATTDSSVVVGEPKDLPPAATT